MTYKIVSQLDAEGYFIGEAVAQESPLEPGVFLIPGGAVDVSPPQLNSSKRLRFVHGQWNEISITPDPEPVKTEQQIQRTLTMAVQTHMNRVAQAVGYDNIYTAVTYANEPAVQKYQIEGLALRAWRSLVWAKCYEVMDEVKAGTRTIPTAEELISLLPAAPSFS